MGVVSISTLIKSDGVVTTAAGLWPRRAISATRDARDRAPTMERPPTSSALISGNSYARRVYVGHVIDAHILTYAA